LFLGVLAVAWIVVLVPPVLRARADSRNRGDSIGDFQNRLGVLSRTHSARHLRRAARAARADLSPMPGVASALGARREANDLAKAGRLGPRSIPPPAGAALTGPVTPLRSRRAEASARRRREVVTVLFAVATLSAAVASALGGTATWAIQILTDLALLVYVVGMLWFRNNVAGRAQTVHYLPQVRPRPAHAYALRRTASS
jgi:hypothetical protein